MKKTFMRKLAAILSAALVLGQTGSFASWADVLPSNNPTAQQTDLEYGGG